MCVASLSVLVCSLRVSSDGEVHLVKPPTQPRNSNGNNKKKTTATNSANKKPGRKSTSSAPAQAGAASASASASAAGPSRQQTHGPSLEPLDLAAVDTTHEQKGRCGPPR